MRELTQKEVEEVSGGLDLQEGGLALIGVGLAAAGLGPVGLAAFAVSAGTTMLVGGAVAENS